MTIPWLPEALARQHAAILDSVRDYPGQYVDRTIAIWRIRERRGLSWEKIGDLFGIGPLVAEEIAVTYSPGNYCALMVEGRQCGKPSVKVFDWPIANTTARVGFCADHVDEHGERVKA